MPNGSIHLLNLSAYEQSTVQNLSLCRVYVCFKRLTRALAKDSKSRPYVLHTQQMFLLVYAADLIYDLDTV